MTFSTFGFPLNSPLKNAPVEAPVCAPVLRPNKTGQNRIPAEIRTSHFCKIDPAAIDTPRGFR
jgi:hypothetical protein